MALITSSWARKMLPAFRRGLIVPLLAGILFVPAPQVEGEKERSGQTRVYNLILKEGEPIDQLIREHYGRKYEVVEIRNDRTYSSARLTKSRFPNPVFDDNNVEVAGSVRVCIVITAGGRVVDPFVYGSANPRLEGPVLAVLNEFRAVPARFNGAPIATVETLKFTFGPPPRRRIDR